MSETSQSSLMVFLFTDIAGSVDLKARLGDSEAARLISRHDELFRQTISLAAAGKLDQDTGDGFLAQFATASDAVQTALRFQRAIHNEPWGDDPIRVRAGVHLGEVAPTGGANGGEPKLIGFAKDIAARLMGLAMPGQILMSRASFDAARQYVREHPGIDSSEPSPELRWMAHGPYLFKGAEEPMDVFEVGAQGIAKLRAPPNSEKAKRAILPGDEDLFGWRPAIGQTIPRREHWILDRKIGAGGFGEVWVASQRKVGTHRVFKFCFDAEHLRSLKRELTLFRLLREALGDRPDIAKLHDIQLDKPPFYLESEFTELGNLADWAEAQGGIDQLPLTTRLDLVTGACDAVAAAYSVGILHKDIKPSNILIYEDADGSPCPRLCDFGIGILTDRSQLERHDITLSGFTEILPDGADSSQTGTWMYAPPETLMGEPFTIQGDVYALGVLLYQMAAGDLKRPLAPGWESDVADSLLREDIASAVAGRPEDRLRSASELSQRLRTLDERRKTRRRRYATKVAATVSGIVLGLLVVVGAGYLHDRGQRERIAETQAHLAASLGGSLIPTIVIDTKGECLYANDALVRMIGRGMTKEELENQNVFTLSSWIDTGMADAARKAFDTGESVRMEIPPGARATTGTPFSADAEFVPYRAGDKQYLLVTLYDNTGRTVLEFLSWILTGTELRQDPRDTQQNLHDGPTISPRAKMTTVREILADAAEAVGTHFVSRPAMEADIRSMLGRAYINLGLLDEAQAQFESALKIRSKLVEGDDLMVAASMHDLGEVLSAQADYVKAEDYFRQALAMRHRLLGDSHVDIASVMHDLAKVLLWANQRELAKENFDAALDMRINLLGPEDLAVAESLHEMVYVDWGDPSIVEPRLERALEIRREKLGDDHLLVADTLITLADSLTHLHGYRTGRYSEAEGRLREAVRIHRKVLSENHPKLAESLFMLGAVLGYQRKYLSAESALTEALEIRREVFGDQHPLVAWTLDALMWLHFEQNHNERAERYYEEAMEIWWARDQDRHTDDAHSSLRNLAPLMQARGDVEWAERIYCDDLKLQREKGGDDSSIVAQCLLDLAGFLQETKDDDAGAESLVRQALAILKAQGPQLEEARAHYRLAVLLQDMGDYDESEEELLAAEGILQQDFPANTPWVADLRNATQTSRVLLAYARGIGEQAGPSAEEIASRWSGWRPSNAWPMSHWPERQSLLRLAALMLDRANFDAAEELYRVALDAWADRQHPGRATAHNHLADLFVLKGDAAAAEQQWRLALDIQREVLRPSHPAIGETLLGLGELLYNGGVTRFDEAEDLLLESHRILKQAFGPEDKERTVKARGLLVSLYVAQGKSAEADKWRSNEPIEGGQTPVKD